MSFSTGETCPLLWLGAEAMQEGCSRGREGGRGCMEVACVEMAGVNWGRQMGCRVQPLARGARPPGRPHIPSLKQGRVGKSR